VVKTYYDEFDEILPQSQKKYAILGLFLLYLLSYNKIQDKQGDQLSLNSEYHTEIELIPIEELSNVYIKVPISLEQYFVEGSYNKILSQKQNVPLQAYQFFIDKFVDAIRFEVARSAERAYESLSLKDMGKMLMISDEGELRQFIEQNNLKDGVGWGINNADGRVYFNAGKKEKNEIPSYQMINLSLEYATELNKII